MELFWDQPIKAIHLNFLKMEKLLILLELIIEGYKSLNLDGLIIIGGDGSMQILKN